MTASSSSTSSPAPPASPVRPAGPPRTDRGPARAAGRTGAGGLAHRLVDALSGGVAGAVASVLALFWLVPTLGLAVSSLRSPHDIATDGWWNVLSKPSQLTLHNYRTLLANERMVSSFWNTLLITVPSALLVVGLAALAAYAFAWIDFPGRDALFLLVIGLLVVPLQIAFIPVARLYGSLGIFGDTIGVVLFHVAFGLPFAVFLLRNFFAGIPRDLLEAARMDGAGELRTFTKVVLPLGIPAIASLVIFQFLWVWNDLVVSLVFARPDAAPLTIAIRDQTRQFGSNIDIISSGAFLSMIVPLVVFFAFQRFFVQGLLAGSVK